MHSLRSSTLSNTASEIKKQTTFAPGWNFCQAQVPDPQFKVYARLISGLKAWISCSYISIGLTAIYPI
jgi:hypothetical protein